jgi:long-chain acyl-CoA synthetase
VKRREVRASLEGAMSLPRVSGAAECAAEDRASRVRRVAAEVGRVPVEQVQAETDLALDLNIDSLGRVELALRLEEELGAILDETRLAAVTSVGELVALVDASDTHGPRLSCPRWALAKPVVRLRAQVQNGLLFPLHARAVSPLRVEGRQYLEHVRRPALFIANHASHLDTPTVLRALPADLRRNVAVAAAADYFFRDPRLAFATSFLLNAFPFSRDTNVRESLEYCGELIDAGWSILVYPEGTRSATGALQPFKRGIGLLAAELRVPVLPIALTGPGRVLPKGARLPRPGPAIVRFGPPVTVPAGAEHRAVADDLHACIARLLEEHSDVER